MEGADAGHLDHALSQQRAHAMPHFLRGFVGERHKNELRRKDPGHRAAICGWVSVYMKRFEYTKH